MDKKEVLRDQEAPLRPGPVPKRPPVLEPRPGARRSLPQGQQRQRPRPSSPGLKRSENPRQGNLGAKRPQSSSQMQGPDLPQRPQEPARLRAHRPWPWEKILSCLVLIGLALAVLAMAFSIYLKSKYQLDIVSLDTAASKKRDAVLVLGCGVYPDGSPSPMLRDRMQAGIAAYYKGAGKKLLLSGDHGSKHYDEVTAMKNLALEAGVPPENIFLDHAGFSTYDSLKRAKEVFGLESVCLISQKYHLYRACYLADSLGLDYCAYPADAYVYKGQIFREAREVLARVKAIFSATFQPPPEVLGPPIDITGDGQLSWD